MADSTYRLVFQGKISPDHNLATVKSRLQQVFKKDAQTIEKMFSGKKVPLKQGLSQEKAQQYQAKMQSLGLICNVEAQTPNPSVAQPVVASPEKASPTALTSPSPSLSPSPQPETSASEQNVGQFFPTSSSNAADIAVNANRKAIKFIEIDQAFSSDIPPVNLPWSYKAGIVAVGITMVLLPLIYLGLIALIGFGVASHSIEHLGWIRSFGKLGLVAYITPIIAGVTVALFMIKPLFAGSGAGAKPIVLDSLHEPVFFHFVNKIATQVGAPRPKQILIDCQVNASASFRKGLFSFFGDDLVLTIGMPLLAGLNSKQLAGVLAHEFGHFSQGVGMRFHYLTHKVNSWFFSVVYLRDSWDERLEQAADNASGWASAILNVVRGGVWLTRQMLRGFMMAGHAVSSYMLRQMEFDADRYETLVSGSQQFRDTTMQLQKLGIAFQISHDYLAQAWEEKKLVSDFPMLVVRNSKQLPDELDKALLRQIEQSKTQVYDSHPSDKERIEHATALQAEGIFNLNRDNRDMFKQFDVLSKRVSSDYYEYELGLEIDTSKLVDVNEVVQITQENEKQHEAYHDYFKEMAPLLNFPVTVNIFDTSRVSWDDLLQQYRDINAKIADQIGQRRKMMKQGEESYARYQYLLTLDILKESGFVMYPEWFDMDEQGFANYKKYLKRAEHDWFQVMQQLQDFFQLNDQRLSIALTLLNHPQILDANSAHAAHLKNRNRLSLLVNNFNRNAEIIADFSMRHFKLASLVTCSQVIGQKPAELTVMTDLLTNELKQAFEKLVIALGRLDYPFVGEGEHQTIAEYLEALLPKQSSCSNEAQYYLASGEVILEKLDAIYARVLSGLAHVALSVDKLYAEIQARSSLANQSRGMQVQSHQVALAVGAESFASHTSSFVTENRDSNEAEPLEPETDLNVDVDEPDKIHIPEQLIGVEHSEDVNATVTEPAVSHKATYVIDDHELNDVEPVPQVTANRSISLEHENSSSLDNMPDTKSYDVAQDEIQHTTPVKAYKNVDAGQRSVFKIDDPIQQDENAQAPETVESYDTLDGAELYESEDISDLLPLSKDQIGELTSPTQAGAVPLAMNSVESDASRQLADNLSIASDSIEEELLASTVMGDIEENGNNIVSRHGEDVEPLSVDLVSSAMGPELAPDEFSQFEDKPVTNKPAMSGPQPGAASSLTLEPLESEKPQLDDGKESA